MKMVVTMGGGKDLRRVGEEKYDQNIFCEIN